MNAVRPMPFGFDELTDEALAELHVDLCNSDPSSVRGRLALTELVRRKVHADGREPEALLLERTVRDGAAVGYWRAAHRLHEALEHCDTVARAARVVGRASDADRARVLGWVRRTLGAKRARSLIQILEEPDAVSALLADETPEHAEELLGSEGLALLLDVTHGFDDLDMGDA